jgi:hypothetical protein
LYSPILQGCPAWKIYPSALGFSCRCINHPRYDGL